MHSVIYSYCPKSFVDIWQYNNQPNVAQNLRNADQLVINYPRIELHKNLPIYSIPKLWNELDENRFQQSRTTFRICIKGKLLITQTSYSNTVNTPSCLKLWVVTSVFKHIFNHHYHNVCCRRVSPLHRLLPPPPRASTVSLYFFHLDYQ
jgi:hypothetical protein